MVTVFFNDKFRIEGEEACFSFETRANNPKGIVKAIRAKAAEINEFYNYLVNAVVNVTDEEDNVIYHGYYKYDCFSGHGDIELHYTTRR